MVIYKDSKFSRVKAFFCVSLLIVACQAVITRRAEAMNKEMLVSVAEKIEDSEGSVFNVVPVNSVEISESIPKELGMDYRATKEDTEKNCAYFKGIDLDVDHIRSQLFAIKDGLSVIGIATLIVTPFKHLSRVGYLQCNGNKTAFKSIKEILDINDKDTFVIEFGWFHILSKYRNKKLGNAVIKKVLSPYFENLIKTVYRDKKLLAMCTAMGSISREKISNAWGKYLEGETNVEIPLPENFCNVLGQVAPQAKFTQIIAGKLNFEKLKQVYNFSLGPVFMKEFFNKL